jgi:hypothetical protein
MLVLIILNCSGRLISAMEIIVGQPISAISWTGGFSLSVIWSERPPLKGIIYIFWLQPLKPFFLLFKELGPFKILKEYALAKQGSHTYQLALLLTHIIFRLVPLNSSPVC